MCPTEDIGCEPRIKTGLSVHIRCIVCAEPGIGFVDDEEENDWEGTYMALSTCGGQCPETG
jgi:hypothetical protein